MSSTPSPAPAEDPTPSTAGQAATPEGSPAETAPAAAAAAPAEATASTQAEATAAQPEAAQADAAQADAAQADAAQADAQQPDTEDAAPAPAPAQAASVMSPAECAARLKALFPALFAGQPKPLKLRVQADIQARAPGVFSRQVLSAFLRRYTGSTAYLIALSRAKQRFDLDGQPAGELSDEHRQLAADELARRRTVHDARRQQEEQGRRERAALLRDFETTKLTQANFCALKGIAPEQLEPLLAQARQEAEQRRQELAAGGGDHRDRGRGGARPDHRREGGRGAEARGPGGPAERGARGPRQGQGQGRDRGPGGGGQPAGRPARPPKGKGPDQGG